MLTKEQLERRKRGVGGSEVAAVLGFSRRTPLMVYESKLPGAQEWAGNEATAWGNRLEPVIAEMYAKRMAERLGADVSLVALHDVGTLEGNESWMIATPDRIVHITLPNGDEEEVGLEIKLRSFRTPDWGEDGSSQVPAEVYYQCLWCMEVTGLRAWDVAALFSGTEMRVYHLEYDAELAALAVEQVRKFWFENVVRQSPPPATAGDLKAMGQRMPQVFDDIVDVGELPDVEREQLEATASYLAIIKNRLAELEQEKDECEVRLREAIGEHAGIKGEGWGVTWKASKSRSSTDWKAVAEKLGEMGGLATPTVQRVIEEFTKQGEASRRFLFTYKGAQ